MLKICKQYMHDFDRAICKWVRGNDGETKKIRRKNCVRRKKKKVMGVH